MINASRMNASLRALDAHDRYHAGSVAWNDGRRGVTAVGGVPTLSAWGSNITDCCIVTADGGVCQYIKPPNLDETVGVMDARDILVVDSDGTNLSVQDLLDDLEPRCKYMGYLSVHANATSNETVVVRFQTAWVPIRKGTRVTKIVPQHHSYQTHSRADPRNLLVLGTPQGVYVHNDDAGANKLFAHSVTGAVNTHWFEAEANRTCPVGHAAARDDDSRTTARAVDMGIRGMGRRANCFVTVAIPNAQTGAYGTFYDDDDDARPTYRSLGATGVSHAARVSVSRETEGTCAPNSVAIRRPDGEPIVVTVLTYSTLEVPDDFDGDPTTLEVATTDVALGVADLDRQYELVRVNGGVVCKLSELPAMLHKLTAEHLAQTVIPSSGALAAFA